MNTLSWELVTEPSAVPRGRLETATLSGSFLAGDRFFRLMKASVPAARIYHVVMRSGADLCAVVCVTEMAVRVGPTSITVALCGNPIISADCAVFTAAGADRRQLLPTIVRALNELLDERRIGVTFLKEIVAPSSILEACGYFRLPLEPILGLNISPWRSFNEYASSMNKHYRGLIKRAARELQQRGIRVVEEEDVRSIASELFDLFKQDVLRRPPVRAANGSLSWGDRVATYLTNLPRRRLLVSEDFFPLLKREFRSEADVITLRKENRIVGCTVNLQDGQVFHSIYIAMERSADTPFLYRSLLSAKVEHAFQRSVRLVHFGRTCSETKADFGAVAFEGGCYCRVRWGIVNSILGAAGAKARSRQTPFKGRNVFKVPQGTAVQ